MEDEIKDFSIYKRSNLLIIKNNKSLNVNDYCLEINVLDYTPFLVDEKELEGTKIMDCMGIIGIITLEDDTYLVVVTDAKLVCSITKKEIYKVLDTSFIKFSDDLIEEGEIKEELNESDDYYFGNNHDDEIIKDMKELFKNGFYYSNKYDLANSLTSQNQIICFFKNFYVFTNNFRTRIF